MVVLSVNIIQTTDFIHIKKMKEWKWLNNQQYKDIINRPNECFKTIKYSDIFNRVTKTKQQNCAKEQEAIFIIFIVFIYIKSGVCIFFIQLNISFVVSKQKKKWMKFFATKCYYNHHLFGHWSIVCHLIKCNIFITFCSFSFCSLNLILPNRSMISIFKPFHFEIYINHFHKNTKSHPSQSEKGGNGNKWRMRKTTTEFKFTVSNKAKKETFHYFLELPKNS